MPNSPVISIATRADAPAWDAFVESRGDASGYHAWRWRRVFANAFGHDPVYLIARQGGAITGVLPTVHIKSLLFGSTLTSLPFLNYGGVMADAHDTREALIDGALAVAQERRCGHVELRHTARQFPDLPCKQHKVAMRLIGELHAKGLRDLLRAPPPLELVLHERAQLDVGDELSRLRPRPSLLGLSLRRVWAVGAAARIDVAA